MHIERNYFLAQHRIHLINNSTLVKSSQPLFHRRLVGNISISCRYFHRYTLRRSGILFLFLLSVSGPPEAQLTHTRSKLPCLIHEQLYPTNHHSSLEHAIYGKSCLLPFLNPKTYDLSNLRSINLILSLSPLNLPLHSWRFV